MSQDISVQNSGHDDLDEETVIEGHTRLETMIAEALFNELLAGGRAAWTLDDIAILFPNASPKDLLQSVKALEGGDVMTVVWGPGDSAVVKTTPQGFVDYVEHFRGDIESKVAVIANAIAATSCRSLNEINRETEIPLAVIAQVLRVFEFDGDVTLDPNNESILTVDDSLRELYG